MSSLRLLVHGTLGVMIFFTTAFAQERDRDTFSNDYAAPVECYESQAFSPKPRRIGFDPEHCMYFWYTHPRTSPILAHITVWDEVDNRRRMMRIDVVIRNHRYYLTARRYCQWDSKGAGHYRPQFILALPVQDGTVEFDYCGDNTMVSRLQAIDAILLRTGDARNREPWEVGRILNRLRAELERAVRQ